MVTTRSGLQNPGAAGEAAVARLQKKIEKAYFSSKSGGLSSENVFKRAHPQFPKDAVRTFFKENSVVRQFYGVPKSRPKITEQHCRAAYPLSRLHIDIMYLKDKAVPYALVAVCNYSRYAYVQPLVNKTARETARGLAVILTQVPDPRIAIYDFEDIGSATVGGHSTPRSHV